MKYYLSKLGLLLFVIFLASSCNLQDNAVSSENSLNDTGVDSQSLLKVGKGGMIWSDCQLFGTIGTPAHFKPTAGNFDELYNVAPAGASFKDGVTAISESKPGDQDFNGGRWHVNVPKEGVDLGKYADACSVEDLDLNDFEGTDVYFECPLLPRK